MNALNLYLEVARKNDGAVEWHGRECRLAQYRGALNKPYLLKMLAKDTLRNHKLLMRFYWDCLEEVFNLERSAICLYYNYGRDSSYISPREIVKIEEILREMAEEEKKSLEDWL